MSSRIRSFLIAQTVVIGVAGGFVAGPTAQAVEIQTADEERTPKSEQTQSESWLDGEEVEDRLEAPSETDGGFFAPSLTNLDEFLEQIDEKSDDELLVEGIAAQVGNGVVLVSEVRRLAAPVEARMRKAGVAEGEIRAMRSEALDRLIESRIIADIVRRVQLSATTAEIDNAIAAIAQENGLTLEQMTASIASHGLTIEAYRAKIKTEIERNKVLGSMVRSRVHVEDDEVENLYQQEYANQRSAGDEIHLGHLLIGVGASKMRDQDTACRMAGEIRERVTSHQQSFENAARESSDANAERGGDLGWVHLDELAGWMTPAVKDLEPGQLSDVIPMYFGCNLLMVIDRREFKPVTLEDARPALEQALLNQKTEEEYRRWIEKVRKQVYVQRKGIYAEATRLGASSARP